jgi:hypothetical protein
MKKLINISAKFKNEKGVTLVYVALLLVVFLGMAALAIDIGYHRVVRNQLQNAADAAALAGCNRLYDREVVILSTPVPPRWDIASAEAANAITMNTADNKALSVGTITTGWWNITQPSLGLRANTFTPTANDGPAVRVAISKSGNQNAGPIVNFFGGILGVSTTDSSATATAVAASPGSVRPGALVPVAVSKAAADRWNLYHDSSHLIAFGSPYHYPDGEAGQWTTFLLPENNVPAVRDLVGDGNPTELSIGDQIWVQPGTKDNLYDHPSKPSIDNTYAGKEIVFPIVDAILSDTTASFAPIAGFVGFHITCAGNGCKGETFVDNNNNVITVGNNWKIILGYFTTAPAYGGPIGAHYGPLDRCRLCQ